ncbi:hypothetical protein RI054_14g68180 [Pseudoscourfieldia marina]
MRQIAPSTSEDERRKAQGAAEENRTPKPKISPHAALATAVAAEVRRPSRKTRQRSLRMKGFLNSSVHTATSVGKSRSNIPPDCPNPRPGGGRGRGGRGAAGGRGRGYGRGYTRTSGATSRSKHSWEISGELYEAQHRAQFARRITSANRPQAGDNLHNHLTKSSSLVRSRPTAGRLAQRLELYDNRGNTYPIKIVDNFFASRWHRHSTST